MIVIFLNFLCSARRMFIIIMTVYWRVYLCGRFDEEHCQYALMPIDYLC